VISAKTAHVQREFRSCQSHFGVMGGFSWRFASFPPATARNLQPQEKTWMLAKLARRHVRRAVSLRRHDGGEGHARHTVPVCGLIKDSAARHDAGSVPIESTSKPGRVT
jgi:hypothetical protein